MNPKAFRKSDGWHFVYINGVRQGPFQTKEEADEVMNTTLGRIVFSSDVEDNFYHQGPADDTGDPY